MAKHLVKCLYCGKTFDTNIEPFVKPNARRYAHKACAEEADKKKTKEEKDLEILEKYIKDLFGTDCISAKIRKQIKDYKENEHYSYSAIYKTLKYWFDVQGNSIEKANGGIGIVPHVIDKAFRYWQTLSEIQESNKDIKVTDYVLPTVEIHITSPKREPMKHMRKLFTFLDEDEEV